MVSKELAIKNVAKETVSNKYVSLYTYIGCIKGSLKSPRFYHLVRPKFMSTTIRIKKKQSTNF